MDDARKRILALDFDHPVFRMWWTGPLMSAAGIVADDAKLAAAVERVDDGVEWTHEKREKARAMVRDCCKKKGIGVRL